METRKELLAVLRQTRTLLSLPGNDFVWSRWENGREAVEALDRYIAILEAGELPERSDLSLLFAPTGSIQEVSLSSGWADEFLAVASRFDAAEKGLWG